MDFLASPAIPFSGFYDTNPDKFGQVNNFVMLAKNYGNMTAHRSISAAPCRLDPRFAFGTTRSARPG
jgi:hypothetical protein